MAKDGSTRENGAVKVVIIGSGGQLGRDLALRLRGDVVGMTRPQADLTHAESLSAALKPLRPDVVVNCAAYNFVDRAEAEPEAAFAVNAWGVRHLARICHEVGSVLVHISTDYVFGLDAARRAPYAEGDAPGPLGTYGLSKLAGEYLVRSLCPRHFVIRTCGLYGLWGSGGKGGNFVETMLRLAAQGKPIRVVADQLCTPTYTVDLADALVALISTSAYGLYHLTNAGQCSWHEFAQAIFKQTGQAASPTAISSQEHAAPARRPAFSVLDNRHAAAAGVPALRPWPDALAAYLKERTPTAAK